MKENVSYDYAEFNCFKLNISQYGGVPYIWWTVYLIYFVGMKLSAVSVLMMMYINIWVKWNLLCKCTFYVFPFDNKKNCWKANYFSNCISVYTLYNARVCWRARLSDNSCKIWSHTEITVSKSRISILWWCNVNCVYYNVNCVYINSYCSVVAIKNISRTFQT